MPFQPAPTNGNGQVAGRNEYGTPWHDDDDGTPIYSEAYLAAHGFSGWLNPPPLPRMYDSSCNCPAGMHGQECVVKDGGSLYYVVEQEYYMAMDADVHGGGCMDPRRNEQDETANRHQRFRCYKDCAEHLSYTERAPLPDCVVATIRFVPCVWLSH